MGGTEDEGNRVALAGEVQERPDALGGRGEDELLATCETLLLTGEELAGSLAIFSGTSSLLPSGPVYLPWKMRATVVLS